MNTDDVDFLLSEIKLYEQRSYLKDTYLSSDEVGQLLEEDIEDFIVSNPENLEKGLVKYKRQYVLKSGKRLDLLLKDKLGLVVVEIKKGRIGREVHKQIKGYIKEIAKEFKPGSVRGIIVCSDIYPAFEKYYEKEIKKGNIEVYLYSWKFNLRPFM